MTTETQYATDDYERGLAAAYWKFGIPAQGTLAEYHLRAYGFTGLIPNETLRFIPDCPSPWTGIRNPALIAKIENMKREFEGVYIRYLNPNKIERFVDEDPDGALPAHDIIDQELPAAGVRIGDLTTGTRPWIRVTTTLEDALLAHETLGGAWVFDTSCYWSVTSLPEGIRGYSRYLGLEIEAEPPDDLSNRRCREISKYRKLVCTEHAWRRE